MAKPKVAIVGGGAAGLMTAVLLGDATIYDKNAKLGKKILVTGNGRCNLTNVNLSGDNYNNPVFMQKYLDKYGYDYQKALFEDMGMLLRVDDEGRVYPITNSARTVLDVLLSRVSAEFVCDEVLSVVSTTEGYVLTTRDGEKYYDIVVVATGGGTRILDSLHLRRREFVASLVPIETRERYTDLDGVRVKCVATLKRDGEVLYTERGEVLFRKYGLSGICIMNMSAYIAREGIGDSEIYLDILPDVDEDTLVDILSKRQSSTALTALDGILVRALAEVVLKRVGISKTDSVKTILYHSRDIAHLIKNFGFRPTGLRPISEAQVVSGGYVVDIMNEDLSVVGHPNLYIVGEALDIDGLCGGYNLAWAWASASVVAKSINAKI